MLFIFRENKNLKLVYVPDIHSEEITELLEWGRQIDVLEHDS